MLKHEPYVFINQDGKFYFPEIDVIELLIHLFGLKNFADNLQVIKLVLIHDLIQKTS